MVRFPRMDANLGAAAIIMVVGLVSFTLAGGWGRSGDTSWLPWGLGFGAQAAFVGAVLAWRHWNGR